MSVRPRTPLTVRTSIVRTPAADRPDLVGKLACVLADIIERVAPESGVPERLGLAASVTPVLQERPPRPGGRTDPLSPDPLLFGRSHPAIVHRRELVTVLARLAAARPLPECGDLGDIGATPPRHVAGNGLPYRESSAAGLNR